MKRILITLFLGIVLLPVFGQNDPVYGQYMFNPLIINPAYAGVHDMASVYAVFRNQWTGFGGQSPKTFTLSGSTTIPKNNIGLGFSLVSDKIGIRKSNEFKAIGSYKIELGGEKNLSFGLQGGVLNTSYDYSDLDFKPGEEADPNFIGDENGVYSKTRPTIGTGVLWTTKKVFVGLSVPRLFRTTLKTELTNNTGLKLNKNFLLTGGYVFHLKSAIKLKPSVLIHYEEGTKLGYDLNTSLLLKEKIWLGVSVRSFHTVALMGQLKMSDLLTAGLAYELPIDAKGVRKVGSTVELMLNLNMALFDVQAVQSIFY